MYIAGDVQAPAHYILQVMQHNNDQASSIDVTWQKQKHPKPFSTPAVIKK